MSERNDLTCHSGGFFWALNKAFVLVNNVNNGGELPASGP
jgi:hypothetical protein